MVILLACAALSPFAKKSKVSRKYDLALQRKAVGRYILKEI